MSGFKGVYGAGGGGAYLQGGGGSGKAGICQDSCVPVDPCQNVTPAPVVCTGIVDPCQGNQSGGIGGGFGGYGGQVSHGGGHHHHHHHHHHGGHGGQINQGGGVVKK